MTKLSVGSLARALHEQWDWDPDAAYAAAWAYVHGTSTPRTYAQAIAALQRSKPATLSAAQVAAIHAAYRRVKCGTT